MHTKSESTNRSVTDIIDRLYCKRKVALNKINYSDNIAKTSTYVLQLARSERNFLNKIFESIPESKTKILLKSLKDETTRHNETMHAIQKGYDFIFNGFLISENKKAKYDALIKLKNKHYNAQYTFCLISKAKEITKNHMCEMVWNCRILNNLLQSKISQVLFYNESKKFINVDTNSFSSIISSSFTTESTLNANNIEEIDRKYPPEHCKNCSLCSYRYSCIPKIKKSMSLSLLTVGTSSRNSYLRSLGIETYNDLASMSKEELAGLNYSDYEINNIFDQANRLNDNKIIFKERIKPSFFEETVPIAVGFIKDKGVLIPKSIAYTYGTSTPTFINFTYDKIKKKISVENEKVDSFNRLINKKLLAFGSDYDWLIELCFKGGHYSNRIINMTSFIKDYVHSPVYGLELSELSALYDLESERILIKNGLEKMYLSTKERVQTLAKLKNHLIKNME